MENLLGGLVGSDGVAKIIGDKVGDGVENIMSQVLSKDKDGKEEPKGGEGGLGGVLSSLGGKKDDDNGAGGLGGMLSSLGGKKDDDNGLAKGAMDLLSGFK
ncbi:uncharacterized protein [Paralichthys olivaceus]|uniref:uncharacterized protein n=1 Tax=Paralichthys olivaceus TaxID=8255 RepID=UPI0037516AFA